MGGWGGAGAAAHSLRIRCEYVALLALAPQPRTSSASRPASGAAPPRSPKNEYWLASKAAACGRRQDRDHGKGGGGVSAPPRAHHAGTGEEGGHWSRRGPRPAAATAGPSTCLVGVGFDLHRVEAVRLRPRVAICGAASSVRTRVRPHVCAGSGQGGRAGGFLACCRGDTHWRWPPPWRPGPGPQASSKPVATRRAADPPPKARML